MNDVVEVLSDLVNDLGIVHGHVHAKYLVFLQANEYGNNFLTLCDEENDHSCISLFSYTDLVEPCALQHGLRLYCQALLDFL